MGDFWDTRGQQTCQFSSIVLNIVRMLRITQTIGTRTVCCPQRLKSLSLRNSPVVARLWGRSGPWAWRAWSSSSSWTLASPEAPSVAAAVSASLGSRWCCWWGLRSRRRRHSYHRLFREVLSVKHPPQKKKFQWGSHILGFISWFKENINHTLNSNFASCIKVVPSFYRDKIYRFWEQ